MERFIRRCVLVGLLLGLVAGSVSAQSPTEAKLTPAQKVTLKAAIIADGTANAMYQAGNLTGLAAYYNGTASPTFYVYRTSVPIQEVNDQILWANFTPSDPPDGTQTWLNRATQAQGKQFNLQLIFGSLGYINAARPNVRAGLQDATMSALPTGANGALLSGGWAGIRDNVLARAATVLEKLFATTTVQQDGSTPAKAATMTVEGALDYTQFVGI